MRKGFTLIEMIVVLACMTIMSAIIVPNVLASVDNTKLKSDIQSAMIIKGALELFIMENGVNPSANTGTTLVEELKSIGYLKNISSYPQLTDAQWKYDKTVGSVSLDLSLCGIDIKSIARELGAQDLIYVSGIN